MLWRMLIFAGLFWLGAGFAHAPRPGPGRTGRLLLGLMGGTVLLVLTHGLSAGLPVTPGD
ncbi:hypothetical protein QOL99_11125 [Deinococcus sp. MIMF12]|uniref:Uncharacterized protein n=1 Tax=Deinococcus rhizophilus TaxID=3049544 RepID=A0ABT7JI04_9DEIO|nr:hypothetical protein [Deinococcus rhizophilus]MDL2344699.1 hypothetical protein [Deinococcus rhizophilus]